MSYDTAWPFYVPTSPCRCVFVRTFYHHFPIQITKIKKKTTSVTPTPEKTSDPAFSSKVCNTKVKLEIRNRKTDWVMSYAASTWHVTGVYGHMPYARSCYLYTAPAWELFFVICFFGWGDLKIIMRIVFGGSGDTKCAYRFVFFPPAGKVDISTGKIYIQYEHLQLY